jgi:hypothetical protein
MSRQVLCARCAKWHEPAGTRMVLERLKGTDGDPDAPAEFQRLTFGAAKPPRVEQRVAYINGVPYPMDMDHFDCDQCMAPIKPGDRCAAWTVWSEETGPVAEWESEYMECEDGSQT